MGLKVSFFSTPIGGEDRVAMHAASDEDTAVRAVV